MSGSLSDVTPSGGLGVAALVVGAWAVLLVTLLTAPLHASLSALWAPAGVLLLTWLFTGLFITAHDAMHGSLSPSRPGLNHAIGAVCVALFAGFDYRLLRRAHGLHHQTPGQDGDPDWHDGQHEGPLWWLMAFMRRYLTVGQAARLVIAFWIMKGPLGIPLENLLLFWALPSIASTLQLFFVGTWLPHRAPAGGHDNVHNARSVDLPPWLSLLACYHFGYHEEHHAHPHQPWWRLPAVRRRRLETA